MLNEHRVTSLKNGDILVIKNHFRHPKLNGREVVFDAISPRKGYIKGRQVLLNGKISENEYRYRLTDIDVK